MVLFKNCLKLGNDLILFWEIQSLNKRIFRVLKSGERTSDLISEGLVGPVAVIGVGAECLQ